MLSTCSTNSNNSITKPNSLLETALNWNLNQTGIKLKISERLEDKTLFSGPAWICCHLVKLLDQKRHNTGAEIGLSQYLQVWQQTEAYPKKENCPEEGVSSTGATVRTANKNKLITVTITVIVTWNPDLPRNFGFVSFFDRSLTHRDLI